MKNIVISIGAFSAQQVMDTLQVGKTVIAYDPRPVMCKAYAEIQHPNFSWFSLAVSGKSGRTTFFEHGGSSTIVSMTNCPFQIDDRYEVDVISMASVLKLFDDIEKLVMNCEGAEISIIMDTPLDLLSRCKRIEVEFHRFCSYLNVTEDDIQHCIGKLKPKFSNHIADSSIPYISFVRL